MKGFLLQFQDPNIWEENFYLIWFAFIKWIYFFDSNFSYLFLHVCSRTLGKGWKKWSVYVCYLEVILMLLLTWIDLSFHTSNNSFFFYCFHFISFKFCLVFHEYCIYFTSPIPSMPSPVPLSTNVLNYEHQEAYSLMNTFVSSCFLCISFATANDELSLFSLFLNILERTSFCKLIF